jgi:hypothetical protein
MLVRLVLLPALMRAFGRHAWALPRRLERMFVGCGCTQL